MSVAHSHLSFGQAVDAPYNDNMDDETAALIAKFALEDLEEATSLQKGKGRADAPMSDEEYAYQLQSENYREFLTFTEDVKYAQSLHSALDTDAYYLEAIIIAEAAAAQDRRMAEMLSRGETLPPPAAAQTRLEDPKFVMYPEDKSLKDPPLTNGKQKDIEGTKQRPASALNFRTPVESLTEDPINYDYNYKNPYLSRDKPDSYTSTAGSGSSGSQKKVVQCTICDDRVAYNKALHTTCDHHYCGDCTSSLVDNFTRDESLYPLRCCQDPIPITSINPFISSALKVLFLQKHAEFSVLSKNRLYCVNPTCSTFLGSSENTMETGVVCPTCQTSTCPRCKQPAHGLENCKAHAATLELREMAREAGWQTCPGCNAVVELSIGCYHMTCRCRSQFCYLCAAPWKTCTCVQWDEDRLVEAAQQRIQNEMGARAFERVAPEVMNHQVNERVEELRTNHQCDSHTWQMRHGGGHCEGCDDTLPRFLMICKNCSLLLCRRCTFNRSDAGTALGRALGLWGQ